MPDWITHIGIAWLGCRITKRTRYFTSIVLVGSILPDIIKIVLRPAELLLGLHFRDYKLAFLLEPLHSLIGVTLLALAMACFLAEGKIEAKELFLGFSLGYLSHFLLDHLSYFGIALLVPLSWERFALELFWPDDLSPMIIVASLVAIVKLVDFWSGIGSSKGF